MRAALAAAMRDLPVIRCACTGPRPRVGVEPSKGGEPPDSDAAGHLQHQAEADVSLEMRRRRCMTDVERRRSTWGARSRRGSRNLKPWLALMGGCKNSSSRTTLHFAS